MKNKPQSFPEIRSFRHLKLFAVLKSILFFAGTAVLIGGLSYLIVYPLWNLSGENDDSFATVVGLGCLFCLVIFFIFRLIRSIKELRADEFVKKLFHIINFLIFCTIHSIVAILFMQMQSAVHAEIPGLPPAIFFVPGMVFQIGIILTLFIAIRIRLLSKGIFLFYTICTLTHFTYWIVVFLWKLQFLYTGIEILLCLGIGGVIYGALKSSGKHKEVVSPL